MAVSVHDCFIVTNAVIYVMCNCCYLPRSIRCGCKMLRSSVLEPSANNTCVANALVTIYKHCDSTRFANCRPILQSLQWWLSQQWLTAVYSSVILKTELFYIKNATTSLRSHKMTSLARVTLLLCLKIKSKSNGSQIAVKWESKGRFHKPSVILIILCWKIQLSVTSVS